MSSLDQDVAAILGVSAERLEPPMRQSASKGNLRRVALYGVLASVIAVPLGIYTHLSISPAPKHAQTARASIAQARSAAALSPPAPALAIQPSGPPVALTASPSQAQDQEQPVETTLPPPPPPPTAAVLAKLTQPSPPKIASPPGVHLATGASEKMAKLALPRFDEPAAPRELAPEWLSSPSVEEVERAYPESAMRDSAPGSVVLDCVERVDGSVRDCRVVDERPVGSGFGRAALRLSRSFRFSPQTVDGRAIESDIEIPYDFAVID